MRLAFFPNEASTQPDGRYSDWAGSAGKKRVAGLKRIAGVCSWERAYWSDAVSEPARRRTDQFHEQRVGVAGLMSIPWFSQG
jgi:hypothetical protein